MKRMNFFKPTLIPYGICLLFVLTISCSRQQAADNKSTSTESIQKELRQLEEKWLEYEFALDTASISAMLDDSFVSLSGTTSADKKQELEGIYKNISNMYKDSIFLDSIRIEEPFITKVYGKTAITIFTCHSYKKNRGRPVEKRTRFYDVWVQKNEGWKAVASQATVISEE